MIKKIQIFLVVCCSIILITERATAATCAEQGVYAGGACPYSINSVCSGPWHDPGCVATDCEGTCLCMDMWATCEDTGGCEYGCENIEPYWTSYPAQHFDRVVIDMNQNSEDCSCSYTFDYRCHAGYYVSGYTNGVPVCSGCPCKNDKDGASRCGATAGTGLPGVGGCTMSSGYVFADATGFWNFPSSCAYTP